MKNSVSNTTSSNAFESTPEDEGEAVFSSILLEVGSVPIEEIISKMKCNALKSNAQSINILDKPNGSHTSNVNINFVSSIS